MNLAELSRLKLDEAEIASLQKDISNILDYVAQVNAAQAADQDKKPLVRNVMRNDEARAQGDLLSNKEKMLTQAFPKEEHGYNVVRKIIQKDE